MRPLLLLLIPASLVHAGVTPDVPDRYLFDPVARTSSEFFEPVTATGASKANSTEKLKAASTHLGVQVFCKPETLPKLKPKQSAPVVTLRDETGDLLRIELHRTRLPHAHLIWRAVARSSDGTEVVLQRQRYKGVMYPVTDRYRHFAVLYDSKQKSATFFIDYMPQAVQTIGVPEPVGTQTLLVGGGEAETPMRIAVCQPTVSVDASEPWHFLRATPHDLSGSDVSFEPHQGVLPLDSGHVDLKLRFGAIGDGVHDDTAALQRAFEELDNRVPIAHNTLLIPPGTYLVSDTCAWSRYLVVQGSGEDDTIIQLIDSAPGFDDASTPKPVIACTNYGGRGRGSGSAMSNFLFGLTINTGSGNPGATGIRYHTNNHGALRDVVIRSGDGAGVAGIDMTTPWPGPGLIEDVTIRGFDTGVLIGHREYSMVLVGVTLIDQKTVGIHNKGNSLTLERLTTAGPVPAIINEPGGLVVLVDSELMGSNRVLEDHAEAAIINRSALHVRNTSRAGYYKFSIDQMPRPEKPEEVEVRTVTDSRIELYSSHEPVGLDGRSSDPLLLPIERRPEIPWGDVQTEWTTISRHYLETDGDDFGPALQRAIDSGARTVCIPEGVRVTLATPVVIRGRVQRLIGMKNSIKLAKGIDESQPLLTLDTDEPAVIIERLEVPTIKHVCDADLILRDAHVSPVLGTPGCGRLFLEDAMGVTRFNESQRVWARQLNCESKGDIPEITNDGATLLVLGYKTEYASVNLLNRNGARTELLGGLIYPVQRPPVDMPMFANEDAELFLVHAISAYSGNHKTYMRESHDGAMSEFGSYRWFGGRMLQPGYGSGKQ